MNKHLYDGTDDKTRREEFLAKKMKEFLAKGGKIEILPACMNSEEYNNMKMKPLKRKKAKSK
jgi:hypothetical protein